MLKVSRPVTRRRGKQNHPHPGAGVANHRQPVANVAAAFVARFVARQGFQFAQQTVLLRFDEVLFDFVQFRLQAFLYRVD
jgi:hypothetical protein